MTRKTGNATKQVDINLSIILIAVVEMGILVPHIYSFLGEVSTWSEQPHWKAAWKAGCH